MAKPFAPPAHLPAVSRKAEARHPGTPMRSSDREYTMNPRPRQAHRRQPLPYRKSTHAMGNDDGQEAGHVYQSASRRFECGDVLVNRPERRLEGDSDARN